MHVLYWKTCCVWSNEIKPGLEEADSCKIYFYIPMAGWGWGWGWFVHTWNPWPHASNDLTRPNVKTYNIDIYIYILSTNLGFVSPVWHWVTNPRMISTCSALPIARKAMTAFMVWVNARQKNGTVPPRVSYQNWHRDPPDLHIWKSKSTRYWAITWI